MLLLASCSTNLAATKPVEPSVIQKIVTVDTACQWLTPIYISRADVLTDGTARQILAYDKTYVANCGKPSKLK